MELNNADILSVVETSPCVRTIMDDDILIAQVYSLSQSGVVSFPTPENAEMQCGFGQVAEDVSIPAHIHNSVHRTISNTSEFILIIEGNMRVVFLGESGKELCTLNLGALECFLQFRGGHQIEFSAGTRYVELKQGPYLGHYKDKTVLSN